MAGGAQRQLPTRIGWPQWRFQLCARVSWVYGRAGEGAGNSLPAESGERQGKSGQPFQIRAEDLIWGSQVI